MTLETLRNELDITRDDPKTNLKLSDILRRAQSTLNEYAGEEIDFEDETTWEAQLLLDCCRYMWNHAFEDFETNFRSQLISLRAKRQVRDYAASQSDAETEDTGL